MTKKCARVRLALGFSAVALAATACSSVQEPTLGASQAPTAAAQQPAVTATPLDQPVTAPPASATMVLAGGCFWGVQGLFQHVKGVTAAESGYVGGTPETANYPAVETGTTAHTEAVRLTFDPAQVSERQLLQVFFTVVEDPGQVTHPVRDAHSRQYQSAIYAQGPTQKDVAQSAIAQLDEAGTFPGPIVTAVLPATAFYPAERYHQDFMATNPSQPYIASTEMPKLASLRRQFPDQFRDDPVLQFPGVR